MVKVTNIFGDEYSGKVGEAGVFAKWKGRQYRRKYVKPSNPKTAKQTNVRNNFTNAVNGWHKFLSIQKKVFSYLGAGQTMSGFNLWVSRYQKLATSGQTPPQQPVIGYKQFATAETNVSGESLTQGAQDHNAGNYPIALSSLSYDKGSGSVEVAAIVERERGIIRFPAALTGDITADYEAGGRKITGEVIATDPAAGSEYHLFWLPVDAKKTHVYKDGAEINALEVSLDGGEMYFTLAAPDANDASVSYAYITPLEDAKVEAFKADTTFVVWREYSGTNGGMWISATVEDGNYDEQMTAPGYMPGTSANISAAKLCKDEVIIMSASAEPLVMQEISPEGRKTLNPA